MASTQQNQVDSTPKGSTQEQLSAMLDGEPIDAQDQELARLLEAEDSRAAWHRYALIGDAMRSGNRHDPAEDEAHAILGGSMSFADKLKQTIADEPTVLAPRKRGKTKLLQPVAGLALAASVAGVAVIGVQQMMNTTEQAQPLSAASINAAEQVLATQLVAGKDQNTETPELEIDLEEHQRRLNSYLVNYNAQRTSLGMPGVNPYVRIVGFESEK